MRMIIALNLALMVAGFGAAPSSAQELTQTDRQGPVTVAVTLSGPPVVGTPVNARVVLDTHSIALDGIAFETAVVLRGPDGVEVAPTAVEQAKGSGHHREALLSFPPVRQPGTVQILVKAVGGVPERVFPWEWRR